jgi:hypothetical protein
MLELFDELYGDEAYLRALCDWLKDTEGEDSVMARAVELLVSGEMVIIRDPRVHPNGQNGYDLLCKVKGLHTTEFHVTEDYLTGVCGVGREEDGDEYGPSLAYGYLLEPYVNWYRYSRNTPTLLLNLIVGHLEAPTKHGFKHYIP